MSDKYLRRIAIVRVTFLLLVTICVVLQKNNLTDYVVLIGFLILFCGIFSMSDVEITRGEVRIRKNYFWGLVGLRWNLDFEQITSLRTKDYEIEMHDDASIFSESLFILLAFDFFKPRARWMTTRIEYRVNGIERDVELKLSRDDYRLIDRRIKRRV